MSKHNPTNRLAKLTLRLIYKDLVAIKNFQKNSGRKAIMPGLFSLTLTRYFAVLMNHKKTTEKLEDEQRKALRNKSIKELKLLAGLEDQSAKAPLLPDEEIQEPREDLAEAA